MYQLPQSVSRMLEQACAQNARGSLHFTIKRTTESTEALRRELATLHFSLVCSLQLAHAHSTAASVPASARLSTEA